MWEYHRPDELDDYLYHAKYIKRERVNGKWRYWYEDVKTNVSNKAKTVSNNLQKKANTASINVKKKVNSAVNDAKKQVNSKLNEAKKQVNSKVKDAKKQVTKSYNQFEKNAKNTVVDTLKKHGYEDAANEVNKQYAEKKVNSTVKKVEKKANSVSNDIQKKAKNTYNDIQKKAKNAITSTLEKSGNKEAAKGVNKEYAKQKIESAAKSVVTKAKTASEDIEKKLSKYKDSAMSEASKVAERGRERLDEIFKNYKR